jgi:hypothetical protein
MRRFRVMRGGRPAADEPDDRPSPDDPLTRALRDVYAPPPERYWDSLESRVVAAVRAGRSAPSSVSEWWHALAGWARPGLAAASVLVVVAGAAVQARVAREAAPTAGSALEPMDADLARALDLLDTPAVTPEELTEARDAADLLIDGVYRRPVLPLPHRGAVHHAPAGEDEADEVLRARREATFRYLMP